MTATEQAIRHVLSTTDRPLTWFEIVKHPGWPASVSGPLFRVLRAGAEAGWLVRTVVDNTVRWRLAEAAGS